MIREIRLWLIRLVVGDMPVAMNLDLLSGLYLSPVNDNYYLYRVSAIYTPGLPVCASYHSGSCGGLSSQGYSSGFPIGIYVDWVH